jgi:predicted transcriptional regulator
MTVEELAKALGLKVLAGSNNLGRSITGAYVSDMLSDVMGNAAEGNVLITIQAHKNVAAVASLRDLAAIVVTRGVTPEPDCIRHCEAENIPLLSTAENTFEVAGKIYTLLRQ